MVWVVYYLGRYIYLGGVWGKLLVFVNYWDYNFDVIECDCW